MDTGSSIGGHQPRLSRREAWTLTAIVLLVLAVLLRQGALALLGAGLLTAALSVGLWQRYALRGVTYRRTIGERRAFWGEEVPLVVEVANRKLLPLPWLEADDSIPTVAI